MEVVGQIWDFINARAAAGQTPIALYGSRRCSKTWTISQFLLRQMFDEGDKVIFASMTETQGDEGAYADCKNIIATNEAWTPFFQINSSPRRITCKFLRHNRRGVATFRSFKDPNTAKGAACDWIYINEANAFTLQQYYALSANARKGVILDYNPEDHVFWAEEIVKPENRLQCFWQWNRRHLSPAILQWFEHLKEKGTAENATAADKAFYRRYYLGEYAEISGSIFTAANIRRERFDVKGMQAYFIYGDPSAMCGADYFALVLAGIRDGQLYIVDTWSKNVGCKYDVAEQIRSWCHSFDVREIFIEGNGLVGKTFIEEQRGSFPNLRPYTNTDNKHGRILGNYEGICTHVVFNDDDPDTDEFLRQVYAYEGKNSTATHDDNIDAVNSAYEIARRRFRAF